MSETLTKPTYVILTIEKYDFFLIFSFSADISTADLTGQSQPDYPEAWTFAFKGAEGFFPES